MNERSDEVQRALVDAVEGADERLCDYLDGVIGCHPDQEQRRVRSECA